MEPGTPPPPPGTPAPLGDVPPVRGTPPRSASLTRPEQQMLARSRRSKHMQRSRSAPDCKHSGSKIKIGVCAMDKKAKSKPMCEILQRLTAGGEFEVVAFGDNVILEQPVDCWPLCDVMLSWHSEGFPLRKAQAYARLRRPFLINDVHSQDLLLDRRRVYKTLMDNGIPVPRHILVNRDLPAPDFDTSKDIDELTTSSSSAGSSPRAPASPAPPAALGAAQGASPGGEPGAGGAPRDPPGFAEGEDYVELDGVRIDKPFVEKPVNGEDHNVHVYYPHSMGGGVKRLFRKVDNKSADYDPHHPGTVRRDGSYLYEEFLTTGGTDVKVYTVGPRYAHAEARKSPVVDGKVNRTPDGKEVRFPVLLSPQEKEIARMVCLAFGQRVCGFDLLRSETGRSYVCDVNGWSFVKNSRKYYDDAAGILRSIVLSQLAPHRLAVAPEAPIPLSGLLEEVAAAVAAVDGQDAAAAMPEALQPHITSAFDESMSAEGAAVFGSGPEDEQLLAMKEVSSLQDLTSLDGGEDDGMGTDDSSSTGGGSDSSRFLELRCVLAIVRHGDRTPKQKMKITVSQAPLLELFAKYKDAKGKQAKLKSPGQLQELLDVVRGLLADMEAQSAATRSTRVSSTAPSTAASGAVTEEERAQELHQEQREKLRIVRTVLEQGGTFAGINRKVQLKPTKWSAPSTPGVAGSEPGAGPAAAASREPSPPPPQPQPPPGSKRTSSTGGAAPGAVADSGSGSGAPKVSELLLILKYGGVLTHAGRAQAEELGRAYRMVMYPRYGPAGGGLLRLHSTYRHDMKIYSSDEGRVQMSAAAFIKGLLDLEGSSLTPILVSLVTKNAVMLDAFGKGASDDILAAKATLYQHLTWDADKAMSHCSKLTLPLATPVVGVTPPGSPKHGSGTGALAAATGSAGHDVASPFISQAPLRAQQHSGGVEPDAGPLGATGSVQCAAFPTSALPTTSSCMDLLQQGRASLRHGASSTSSSRPSSAGARSSLDAGASTPTAQSQARAGGGSSGSSLAAAAATNAAVAAAAAHKLASSTSSAVRSAEARAAALAGVRAMPDRPLLLLYRLVELMKVLVDLLREKCLEERLDTTPPPPAAAPGGQAGGGAVEPAGGSGGGPQQQQQQQQQGMPLSARGSSGAYSSLTTSPDDWRLDETRPCSGERLLLMFDRWRKLLKSFYHEKKQQFDCSKVSDVYDSAKYDAIHNAHLQLMPLNELFHVSRQLAAVVVPNEYGLDGPGKLLIGSKICAELLGKLMCDLDSMKEESIITAAIEAETAAARAAAAAGGGAGPSARLGSRPRATSHASLLDGSCDAFDAEFGHMSLEDELMRPSRPAAPRGPGQRSYAGSGWISPTGRRSGTGAPPGAGQPQQAGSGEAPDGQEQEGEQEPDGEGQQEQETLHRLCPRYASDINSPLRHVRTRIYFTSESHIHSLLNVLRCCHLLPAAPSGHSAAASAAMSKAGSLASMPSGGSSAACGGAQQQGAGDAAAAAAAVTASDGGAAAAAAAAVAASGGGAASATAAAGQRSVFAAASAAAAAAAAGDAPACQGAAAAAAATGTASGDGQLGSAPLGTAAGAAAAGPAPPHAQAHPLLTPEGQALLDGTDEFDYLTQIVFRMYENKAAPVDAPERFFVEIQFSNGANYDPTAVVPARHNHTLPAQPRRLLTAPPGVPLQTLQELVRRFARGTKNTPSTYQLQVALRAPLAQAGSASVASKLPTPGTSRAASGALHAGPLPPAAAAALLAAGPGTAP